MNIRNLLIGSALLTGLLAANPGFAQEVRKTNTSADPHQTTANTRTAATELQDAATVHVGAEEGEIKLATITINNQCPEAHRFRIKNDIKYLNFEQPADAVLVGAGSSEQLRVIFDATGLASRFYSDKLTVECLDCKRGEGCTPKNNPVPIEMIVSKSTASKEQYRLAAHPLSSLAIQSSAYDIGIIPETWAGCPVGSQYVYFSMDDEDNHPASSVTGWTGGGIVRSAIGTWLGFCRVDGTQFYRHPTMDYAVLQLGSCPNGSISIFRVFDNEHNNNQNSSSGASSIAPSTTAQGAPTQIYFCFFPSGGTMASFPNEHVPYGVFAAPSPSALATGYAHTDDEDDNNHSYTGSKVTSNLNLLFRFANIIYGTENGTPLGQKNTNLLVAKVANNTCAPNQNACPSIGSYDGANCYVGSAPAGTHAFIWSTNFYYTPVNGNQCPKPGSSFDLANCYVTAIPQGTSPFIWSNAWYVAPACHP